MDEYFEFNRKVIDEALRVSGLVIYNIQMITGNKPALMRLMGHYAEQIKEIVIWDKETAQPAMQTGVMNSQFEFILFLTADPEDAMIRQFKNAAFERGTLSNVFSMKREQAQIEDHGAVFPMQLAKKVLMNFCPAGGSVMDPFSGSGTTAIACHDLGLKFLGIELDPEYHAASVRRIDAHRRQLSLL